MRKSGKKALSLLLALCMALGMLPGTALAAEEAASQQEAPEITDGTEVPEDGLAQEPAVAPAIPDAGGPDLESTGWFEPQPGEPGIFQDGAFSGPQTIPGQAALLDEYTAAEAVLYQEIEAGLRARADSISITPFPCDSQDRLVEIFYQVVNDCPELFYCRTGLGWSENSTSIVAIRPSYLYSKDEAAAKAEEFNRRVSDALAHINGITDPLEKVLILHDYLTVTCQYADPIPEPPSPVYSAYGALVNQEAVCQGYSLAFKLLMKKINIPCVMVEAESMNHVWNAVQLDGKWYHVDVTWDDPLPNHESYSGHTYFLRSNAKMLTEGTGSGCHYGWDVSIVSPWGDAEYDGGWIFNDAETPIYQWNGSYYYMESPDPNSNVSHVYKASTLHTDTASSTPVRTGLTRSYSCGIVWRDNYLYYIPFTSESILNVMALNLDDGETITVGEFSRSGSEDVGLRCEDNGLTVFRANTTTQLGRVPLLSNSSACGDKLTWTLDNAGTLIISGTDAMWSWTNKSDVPWDNSKGSIRTLTLSDSVTSIGAWAFCGCSGLVSVTIPNSVTSIGEGAFDGNSNLTDVYYGGTEEQWGAIEIEAGNEPLTSATIRYADTVAVTFDPSGGSVSPTSKTVIPGQTYGELPTPTRTGYTFGGWYTAASGGTEVTESTTVNLTADHTLYAHWATVPVGDPCGDNLAWTLDDDGTLTISGTGDMWDWDINKGSFPPWYASNESIKTVILPDGVTSIGDDAFCHCYRLANVTIPRSVTSIGSFAFFDCRNLSGELTIPGSVTSIGSGAFAACSGLTGITVEESNPAFTTMDGILFSKDKTKLLCCPAGAAKDSYQIPDSVTYIGDYAFCSCSGFTGELAIPNGVTYIGVEAFFECSGLTGPLTIPDGVIFIGKLAFARSPGFTGEVTIPGSILVIYDGDAFVDCSGLTEITVDESNPTYASMDGILFSKDKTKLLFCPKGAVKDSYEIPNGVTSIGDSAFFECHGLTGTLTIPGTVTSIGDAAFYGSGFTGLVLQEGITSIGDSAFCDCSGFTGTLTIPGTVTSIGNFAFRSCSGFTGDLTIPGSVTSIGEVAFYDCVGFDGTLTISDGVTSIGDSAFRGCSGFTGDLTIPGSVTSIGDGAFRYCYGFNGTLTISDGVTSIGDDAFGSCSGFTGDLAIPGSVTSIGNHAFDGCSGFSGFLTIFEGVTSIGQGTFAYCSHLNGVTLPSSVTSIGEGAFAACYGLMGITVEESNPAYTTMDGILFSKDKTRLLCCPAGAVKDSYQIPSSVTSIGPGAFAACSGLTEITVDESNPTYASMDGILFSKDKTKLLFCPRGAVKDSYEIPNGVTSVGDSAFFECPGLTGTLTIPGTVTSIGNYAFRNCYGFTGDLTIPGSVTSIGDAAFSNCYRLTGALTIPGSVTSIGDNAFSNCYRLTGALTIPGSVTSIGNHAFDGCSSFTGILTIFEGVTSIGQGTFAYCSHLNGVIIPSSVTSIGEGTFNGNFDLKDIYYVGTQEQWEAIEIGADNGSLTSATIRYNYSDNGSDFEIEDGVLIKYHGPGGAVTIPNSVTSIGEEVFSQWSGLTSVTIPNSVTSIGEGTFSHCTGLTDVYYGGSEAQWNAVTIESGNDPLKSADIHYNYSGGTVNSYTVTYALDGGSGGPGEQSYTAGTTATIPDAVPVKDGYTFGGWSDGAGATYQPGGSFTMPDHAVTLTAIWWSEASSPDSPMQVSATAGADSVQFSVSLEGGETGFSDSMIVLALYDAKDKMLSVRSETVSVSPGGNKTVTFTIDRGQDLNAARAKVFWADRQNTPITRAWTGSYPAGT